MSISVREMYTGVGTPFEVACAYREAGYDFIAITDHHKFTPSLAV
ncbi:MAG: hypothetical protein ACI4U6_07470 [Acutalibacteraceae bacterium]